MGDLDRERGDAQHRDTPQHQHHRTEHKTKWQNQSKMINNPAFPSVLPFLLPNLGFSPSRHSSSSPPTKKALHQNHAHLLIISRRHAAGQPGQLRPTCHPSTCRAALPASCEITYVGNVFLLFRTTQQRACWGDVTPCHAAPSVPPVRQMERRNLPVTKPTPTN